VMYSMCLSRLSFISINQLSFVCMSDPQGILLVSPWIFLAFALSLLQLNMCSKYYSCVV